MKNVEKRRHPSCNTPKLIIYSILIFDEVFYLKNLEKCKIGVESELLVLNEYKKLCGKLIKLFGFDISPTYG